MRYPLDPEHPHREGGDNELDLVERPIYQSTGAPGFTPWLKVYRLVL